MKEGRVFVTSILLIGIFRSICGGFTQDGTSTRPNTLYDEVDDIQPQLNNEARDKLIYGKPKTVWIFRLPAEYPISTTKSMSRYSRNYGSYTNIFRKRLKQKKTKKPSTIKKDWSYKDQNEWHQSYPSCGGRSQSPVDLPASSLVKAKGCRQLSFINYNVLPQSLTLTNDGKRVVLYGDWEPTHQPIVYGGAAHSRRYLFHSMTLHWPSEHRIGGFLYPLESQIIQISAEYKSLQDAITASPRDSLALLGIVNLYKFQNYTQRGLSELLRIGRDSKCINSSVSHLPLSYFNPPLKKYACYQGSLTVPPCTESVLWLIRARPLAVTRESMDIAYKLLGDGELRGAFVRQTQPLNDRKVCYFN